MILNASPIQVPNPSPRRLTINAAYFTSGGSGQVASTGARSLYLELDTGNTVTIWATSIDNTGKLTRIIFCVQYVSEIVLNV